MQTHGPLWSLPCCRGCCWPLQVDYLILNIHRHRRFSFSRFMRWCCFGWGGLNFCGMDGLGQRARRPRRSEPNVCHLPYNKAKHSPSLKKETLWYSDETLFNSSFEWCRVFTYRWRVIICSSSRARFYARGKLGGRSVAHKFKTSPFKDRLSSLVVIWERLLLLSSSLFATLYHKQSLSSGIKVVWAHCLLLFPFRWILAL